MSTQRASHPATAIVWAIGGLLAVVAAYVVGPRAGVAFTWVPLIAGVAVAVTAPRRRAVAAGLVVAGLALPLAAFLYFWVAITAATLFP